VLGRRFEAGRERRPSDVGPRGASEPGPTVFPYPPGRFLVERERRTPRFMSGSETVTPPRSASDLTPSWRPTPSESIARSRARGNDLLHQSHGQRSLRVDELTALQEVQGVARARDPWEPLRLAVHPGDPASPIERAEAGLRSGDPHVALANQLDSPTDAVPLDRGDQGLPGLQPGARGPVSAHPAARPGPGCPSSRRRPRRQAERRSRRRSRCEPRGGRS
jgi:hypothetical protein